MTDFSYMKTKKAPISNALVSYNNSLKKKPGNIDSMQICIINRQLKNRYQNIKYE